MPSEKRDKITSSMNTMAESGKNVSGNMSITCSIAGAFTSIKDSISSIDLPDFDLGLGGDSDSTFFSDMQKNIEEGMSDISAFMSETFSQIGDYMDDFDAFMDRMKTAIGEKLNSMAESFKAAIILAYGSISSFLEEVYETAASMVESLVDKVKSGFDSASSTVSELVSDMGKTISSAVESLSLSNCDEMKDTAEKIPAPMQSPGVAQLAKNKGKNKGQSVISSLKDGPASSSANNLSANKESMMDDMKFTSPSNEEIKQKILETYPDYFGEGKIDISDVV